MNQPQNPNTQNTQPYLQQFSLNGKIALVTGAARDIGLEIARALAGSGAHVILTGRNADTLASVVQNLTAQGLSAGALAFDVTDKAAVRPPLHRSPPNTAASISSSTTPACAIVNPCWNSATMKFTPCWKPT